MAKTYQTHGDEPGVSNSFRKLERLHFPRDFTGKSFLDIGCAEGFFSAEAARRGAARVVGIDTNVGYLNFAKSHYGSDVVEFQRRDWHDLPDGKFDVVLWSSAMHYELDPKKVIDSIHRVLAPNGLFILECGVTTSLGFPEYFTVPRYTDTTYYPDITYLRDHLLDNFSVREVAPGEVTEGDPVPRRVFHCQPIKPTVVIVTGGTTDGKSFLVDRYLNGAATKVLHLDAIIYRIATSRYSHSDVEAAIKASYDPHNLLATYQQINREPNLASFADYIAKLVAPSDRFVVIEGFVSKEFAEAVAKQLEGRALVWTMSRTDRSLPTFG